MIGEVLGNTLELYLDAAPWLLFGLIAAGLIKAWIPDELINRWLGGRGLWPITKAALIGTPLPLCSCGVLPAALGLHRGGASRGSTVSFLIATPETGADSIALSYALLGPFMALLRPMAAIISAIFSGLLAALAPAAPAALADRAAASCDSSCCDSGCPAPPSGARPSPFARSLTGMRYALSDILDDIAGWLAFGLIAAGLLTTWIPPQTLADWGSGLPAMLLMLLVGIPMYICATASTPLAAALLLTGISPGTVLVFLLAGPATNIATLAVIKRELGPRVLAAYLAGISFSSLALGLATDLIVEYFAIDIQAQLSQGGEFIPVSVAWASALLLAVMAIKPIRQRLLGS